MRSKIIDDDSYTELLEASDNLCWICGHPERVDGRSLAVDHDHLTGAVRGLLCTSCNRRLGAARDPEWMRRAAEYLSRANAAFGDECDSCRRAAPSRLLEVIGDHARFEHRCCRRRWVVSYHTRGIPFAWDVDGLLHANRDPLSEHQSIGHPGPNALRLRWEDPSEEARKSSEHAALTSKVSHLAAQLGKALESLFPEGEPCSK